MSVPTVGQALSSLGSGVFGQLVWKEEIKTESC